MTRDEATVFVVDDDRAVRDSLVALFRSVKLPVESYRDGPSFLQACTGDRIGCVVLDIRMPVMDGFEVQRRLAQRGMQLPIVFLTAHGDIPQSVRAIRSGATNFLTKPPIANELIDCVEEMLRATEAAQAAWIRLTPRERAILAHITRGLGTKEISAALRISARTVEIHRTHLMRKLGVRTSLQAADLARRAYHLDAFDAG